MKAKRVLKFYFAADSLERYIDNLILKLACNFGGEVNESAEKIGNLIGEKHSLANLWIYLDGVLAKFSESEKNSLKHYAFSRQGVKGLPVEAIRAIRSAVIKFTRHAKRLESFNVELVDRYYCILGNYLSGLK